MEVTIIVKLTEAQIELLKEPHLAQFVTLMSDGSPHISPLWVDTDGTHIVINTEEGRVKVRNIRRDPRVAIAVYDPQRPYVRVLNVRGTVVEITPDGAAEHIDFLSEKYTGKRPYGAHNPLRSRLIVRIAPGQISGRS